MKKNFSLESECKVFRGERDEMLTTRTCLIQANDERMSHSVVCIQMGGCYTDKDGDVHAYLDPDDAVAFAKAIIAKSVKANKENSNLLKHGAPF